MCKSKVYRYDSTGQPVSQSSLGYVVQFCSFSHWHLISYTLNVGIIKIAWPNNHVTSINKISTLQTTGFNFAQTPEF